MFNYLLIYKNKIKLQWTIYDHLKRNLFYLVKNKNKFKKSLI